MDADVKFARDPANELHFCVESGLDFNVETSQSLEAVYINSGDNPFELLKDSINYFSSCSVDGVKFVIQNLMETLGSGVGGWVSLTRFYEEALEQSIARNFKYNNLETAVARASEDFMPREPTFQTLHIASVAFNSLLLGEIVVPDWNIDKPGKQDFKILRKLVFPDGSVLRSRYAGWPARDCLFLDPVLDRKSMLKIWNLNKLSGVIGVFNCQGAGSWPHNEVAQDICNATSTSSSIACHVSPHDVEFLEEVYYISGSVTKLPRKGLLEVSLKTLTCELYTISPIKVFGNDLLFAPLGFLDMYNSGGAVEALNCTKDLSSCTIKIKG
uniref:Uncharacterized protein n=1 Tax=Quercus lobata TaxID=97700 RepID=A0A7N2MKY1_QUELO